MGTFGKLGSVLGSAFGPVGTAIGAAAGSVIDGNLAKNDARKKANYNHLEKMRRDAEKAGFNPLTVLRATGGQGFNHGQSAALASSTFWKTFGNSVGQVVNDNDPYNKKLKELDLQQAQASLGNTLASTRLMESQSNPQPQSKYKQEDLFVEIVDPTGNLEPFLALNPDLLDASLRESGGAITLMATQYAAQYNVTVEKMERILRNALANRKANLASKTPLGTGPLEPIETTILETPKLSNWDSHMDAIRKANVKKASFWEQLTTGEIARQNRQMLAR